MKSRKLLVYKNAKDHNISITKLFKKVFRKLEVVYDDDCCIPDRDYYIDKSSLSNYPINAESLEEIISKELTILQVPHTLPCLDCKKFNKSLNFSFDKWIYVKHEALDSKSGKQIRKLITDILDRLGITYTPCC